ncbi:Retrovirus-related Pol polyprotein from transposon gypsy, partial [Mucuna pruriens]
MVMKVDGTMHSASSKSKSSSISEFDISCEYSPDMAGDLLVVRRLMNSQWDNIKMRYSMMYYPWRQPTSYFEGLGSMIARGYHQIHMQKGDEWKTAFKNKCTFCTTEVIFLGFFMSYEGVHVDKEKVKAIQNWPTPTNISDVRSFHGLVSFYKHFVKDFSTIDALLNEIIKSARGLSGKTTKKKPFKP